MHTIHVHTFLARTSAHIYTHARAFLHDACTKQLSRRLCGDGVSNEKGTIRPPKGGEGADSLPRGRNQKDAFFMRSILHDWDDESCCRILRALRSAIGNSGAALLLADVIPSSPHGYYSPPRVRQVGSLVYASY